MEHEMTLNLAIHGGTKDFSFFQENFEDETMTTVYTAGRVLVENGNDGRPKKVHLVIGTKRMEAILKKTYTLHHEGVMFEGKKFYMLPDPRKDVNFCPVTTSSSWFALPAGSQFLCEDDPRFDAIYEQCIRDPQWDFGYVLVRRSSKSNEFAIYGTKWKNFKKWGNMRSSDKFFEISKCGKKFRTLRTDFRCLVLHEERGSVELWKNWKKYVKLTAQEEWGNQKFI